MARWKAHAKFLLSVIELLFLSLAVEALQGKMCQNSLPSGGVRSLGVKISGERVVPLPIYWTDGQIDGIAVVSTALAKRRAVKTTFHIFFILHRM